MFVYFCRAKKQTIAKLLQMNGIAQTDQHSIKIASGQPACRVMLTFLHGCCD